MNSLDTDLQQYGLKHPDFLNVLRDAAAKISSVAREGSNEATISSSFDTHLALALKRIGVDYSPRKEDNLSGAAQRLKGRIDSRVGDVIVEFKQPATYRTPAQQDAALRQVVSYAENLTSNSGRPVVAYVMDGTRAQRVFVDENGAKPGVVEPLTGEVLRGYVQALLSTQLKALSGENLVAYFTGSDSPARELASRLYDALDSRTAVGRTQMLFSEWQLLFKLAHDDTSKQQALADRRSALEEAVGVQLDDKDFQPQYRALFALQTAYSIILKLIGVNVLQGVSGLRMERSPLSAVGDPRSSLQRSMESMEDGEAVRRQGIDNLLEGDFFSWYASEQQFSREIFEALQPIIRAILEFESIPAFHGNEIAARDLFKDLYMHMIPEKVRHSLGEYYTPSWLADDTIEQGIRHLSAERRRDWRLLDPTCGSGTLLTMGMQRIIDETADQVASKRVEEITSRIVGIDLNPLAVLTARLNYFINVASLLPENPKIHIPVYLGDASVAPARTRIGDVECLSYTVRTLQEPLTVVMPVSALRDVAAFTETMSAVETATKARVPRAITSMLLGIVAEEDQTEAVEAAIEQLAQQLVALEGREWNGIWPRIIADFLTTGAIGKFDLVVGNPPWIDWKNLPENYRRTLVDLCIERDIFSGDGVTGGINLNICALIALTSAENWLGEDGVLALLMPDTLLYQQSYEGFRRLKTGPSGRKIYLSGITDWKRAGQPFKPVQQKFFTYVFTAKKRSEWPGVKVREVVKEPRSALPTAASFKRSADLFDGVLTEEWTWAEPVHAGRTYFSRGVDRAEVRAFARIAGESPYRGREGIEFYPQELLLFEYLGAGSQPETSLFRNYQNPKSKHSIPAGVWELEHALMRPVIKGPMIEAYDVKASNLFAPFYYTPEHAKGRSPLPLDVLLADSPRLARLLVNNRRVFEQQTHYNNRIIGEKYATEFYALARVGVYSHAPFAVCYRDNTRWGAAVSSTIEAPWGGLVNPVFQNHAVSISERPDGSFITLGEAHYICSVLNSALVTDFVVRSSESRSFKIRIPVDIPLFDPEDKDHRMLAELSRSAHAGNHSPGDVDALAKRVLLRARAS